MVKGDQLGSIGFKYLGVPYSTMDCQAFVEKCLSDLGKRIDLPGSNAWYRMILNEGWVGTPEECVKAFGKVPKGAFLFILLQDGKEPEKYKPDGIGNASHIGICTGNEGKGAIHSSFSRGCVAESEFHGKTIKNGGWNRVGLWTEEVFYQEIQDADPQDDPDPVWRTTIRRGSEGADVIYAQDILITLGYDLGTSGCDGKFGRRTEEAVKAFQKANGLAADGVVGPLTYEALEKAVEDGDMPDPGILYAVTIHDLTESQMEELLGQFPGMVTVTEERG